MVRQKKGQWWSGCRHLKFRPKNVCMWSCSPHRSRPLSHPVCTKDANRLAVGKTFRWNRPLVRSKRRDSLKRTFGSWCSTKLSEKSQTKPTKIQTITRSSLLRKNPKKTWKPAFPFPRISTDCSRWQIQLLLEWKTPWGKESSKEFSLRALESKPEQKKNQVFHKNTWLWSWFYRMSSLNDIKKMKI